MRPPAEVLAELGMKAVNIDVEGDSGGWVGDRGRQRERPAPLGTSKEGSGCSQDGWLG